MCAFYTFLIPAISAADSSLADSELERLKAGEAVITETRRDESGGSAQIRILVDAPAERIWNVIIRCQYAYRYLAGLEDCEIHVDEPDRALTRHVIDAGLFSPTLDYTFETLRQPFSHMDIRLVEGNLRQVDGYWHFEQFESRILLEHEVHVQPKIPAPRWLVRKKLMKDLPRMMLCIRGLAGGSLDTSAVAQDMAACQAPPNQPQ